MCAIVLTDRCEILIYFITTKVVTVSFKNKYKSLQGEETYLVCYVPSKRCLPRKLCSFNKERKPNSSLVPAYIHCETIVIYLVKETIKGFKGSLMS